jgi:MarR family transcriptional regulator, 2-MHQ and catechol-resistance regulon repressor
MAEANYRELMELLFSVYGILHRDVFRPGKAGKELGRTEFGLMSMLSRNGPTCSSEAAERLKVSRPQMSAIADRLEARGLVSREQDHGDRRSVVLKLTDPGEELLQSALDATEERVKELLSPIGDKELETMTVALRRLVSALIKRQK